MSSCYRKNRGESNTKALKFSIFFFSFKNQPNSTPFFKILVNEKARLRALIYKNICDLHS